MNENSQSTMRALQADEIDQVSGGMLAHMAVWAMATLFTFAVAAAESGEGGNSSGQTTGVRRGST